MAVKEKTPPKKKKTIFITWQRNKKKIEKNNREQKTINKTKNKTQKRCKAQTDLSTEEDLIIRQTDKSEATVIWGIAEYLKESNN